ncbi:MAG: hypothetical protein ABSA49_13945 [Rhizomicrobium sp.]|jgi:hypothetical protein
MSNLAVQFFASFSRLEYALKSIPAFRDGNESGVEPNWDRFAQSPNIAPLFLQLAADARIGYLIDAPPKKRIVRNGSLDWKVMPKPHDMCSLLVAMRRARNNLFHGDKANPNLSRNVDLFVACLAVLDALVAADADIRAAYEINQEMS